MDQFIIYPNDEGGVALIMPTGELALAEVARKDVPAGKPYKIIARTDFADFDFFDAWEADFSTPDGHGIGAEAWFAEQEASK
jgi:hypothetical protein